jgi:hypothetical protein
LPTNDKNRAPLRKRFSQRTQCAFGQKKATRADTAGVAKVMRTILLIILIISLLGALPTWPYSTGWGYYPSGGLGLILLILIILVVMRRV